MTGNNKKVALVLSSGGARGYAHIGAIEALQEHGYEITSVTGASMGALIGGMYAAGRLDVVKRWMESLDRKQIMSLVDFSLGFNHIVKGEKIINALKGIVPDVNIEDLPIPFAAIATDVKSGQEVVFDHGSLYDAIRASISIPSFFQPVEQDGKLLIDGGITNALPLDRVVLHEGDLLVAVNVSAPYMPMLNTSEETTSTSHNKLSRMLQEQISQMEKKLEDNYISLISSSISILIQRSTQLKLQLMPPDILVQLPANHYASFDYNLAHKIIERGRALMQRSIIKYEKQQEILFKRDQRNVLKRLGDKFFN